MKVGIMTIYGGTNYGNKLQNYALQEYISGLGNDVETIRYTVKFASQTGKGLARLKNIVRKYTSDGLYEMAGKLMQAGSAKIHSRALKEKAKTRNEKFRDFEQTHITVTEKYFKTPQELQECQEMFDYIVVGSDQVWNPYWQGSRDEYFLDFCSREQRITYAPSIGVGQIPEEQKERYSLLLKGFSNLSCREKKGAELIKELSGKSCTHVVDPVFLLDREDWRKLEKGNEKNYVMAYFLGGMPRSVRNKIYRYSKERNLSVIDVYDPKNVDSKFASVEEFLYYIDHAETVFTDSFHGCALSVIFGTPFVIGERQMLDKQHTMSSRITSLLEKLGIPDRSIGRLQPEDYNDKTIFSMTEQRLEEWKTESKKYLTNQIR